MSIKKITRVCSENYTQCVNALIGQYAGTNAQASYAYNCAKPEKEAG